MMRICFLFLVTTTTLLSACTPGATKKQPGDPTPDGPVCTDAQTVPCRDSAFQALSMKDAIAPGLVQDELVDGVHETHVDASAGGFQNTTDGWVYGKFTDAGFVKVEILDDDSFESLDWDLAFRRFVIRTNSGTGGPSCVGTADFGPGDFADDVATADATFRLENFFDDACGLIPDGSGLATAAGTVMQGYWHYSNENCLQMTDNVYVLQLADGSLVKLQVYAYYAVTAQEECDTTGGTTPLQSANIRFRWEKL